MHLGNMKNSDQLFTEPDSTAASRRRAQVVAKLAAATVGTLFNSGVSSRAMSMSGTKSADGSADGASAVGGARAA